MADRDRKPHSSIIGRDAEAADGAALIEQLAQTTTEDAGGNVSGTAADDESQDFDIVFEREDVRSTRH